MKKIIGIILSTSFFALHTMESRKINKNPKTKSFRLPRCRSKEKTPKTSLISKAEPPIISIEYLLKNESHLIASSIVIQYSAFSPLESFATLYLRKQNISSLVGLKTIPGIERITELRLENNKLWHLSCHDFEGLKVTSIDLSHNKITSLPENFIDGLNLEFLNLSGNPLDTLQQRKIKEQCAKIKTTLIF